MLVSLEDRAASDQVAGEVTAHQAYNRYGPRAVARRWALR